MGVDEGRFGTAGWLTTVALGTGAGEALQVGERTDVKRTDGARCGRVGTLVLLAINHIVGTGHADSRERRIGRWDVGCVGVVVVEGSQGRRDIKLVGLNYLHALHHFLLHGIGELKRIVAVTIDRHLQTHTMERGARIVGRRDRHRDGRTDIVAILRSSNNCC